MSSVRQLYDIQLKERSQFTRTGQFSNGLLSYSEILELLQYGIVEGADSARVNGSSLDITLGNEILREILSTPNGLVDLRAREPLEMKAIYLENGSFVLRPGEFILAHSREIFHLPLDISCEFKLKSSLARIGINQLTACWCDPGWNNSVMTLELQNVTQYHSIVLRPGDPIGQVVFFRHTPVPEEKGYGARGRYNGDHTVSGIKK